MSATLTFLGAAGTVTGSQHLLDDGERRLLMDCGLFQGLKELRARNWAPPRVDPTTLQAVLLSHAHIDHSGYLPRLVRGGYRGPVFCTHGTADLLRVMLPDAAHLQVSGRRPREPCRPLGGGAGRGAVLDHDPIARGDKGGVVGGVGIAALPEHHARLGPGVAVGLGDHPGADAAIAGQGLPHKMELIGSPPDVCAATLDGPRASAE